MASENVINVTDANFDQEVINNTDPVLVDFWAEWCGPCRMLAPTIDELAAEYKGKVKIGKVDTDSNRSTAMKYNISAIPTIILFHHGQVTKRFVGLTPKRDFKAAIDPLVGQKV
jgi:thioredoxin 1